MTAPAFHGCFPHNWTAEILPRRPMILPNRHYVYPAAVEEVEKGALEVLVQPGKPDSNEGEGKPQPFLATCALGFRDSAALTGIWALPDPDWLCAVSGGYAYLINAANPERFTHLRYRPVLAILHYPSGELQDCADDFRRSEKSSDRFCDELLLLTGHHSIVAWGRDGEAWESDRLSAEGITNLRIEGNVLRGEGWDLRTDKDIPFALDLCTGKRL